MMDLRTIVFAVVACGAGAGCSRSPSIPIVPPLDDSPLLITRMEQLDAAVGKQVVIQGEVTNTKIPTILGVDVVSNHPDLRGQQAQARGILRKWTVTKEQLDKEWAKYGPLPGRGPRTYYRLVRPDSQDDAQVEPLR
jgi:hypothetical protein